jgi:IS5 family transposase
MGKLAHSLRRRNGEAMAEVDRLTGESPSSPGGRCGRSARWRATPAELVPAGLVMGGLGGELDETIISTQRLLWQTEQRLAGNRVIADRLVSLSDPDARPIRKGRPPASTEFGSTMLAAEDERGFVCDHQLQQGNPPDAPQLVPAVRRVAEVTGRVAGTVVGDRGLGTAANDRALAELGVRRIGLQRKGTVNAARAALERTRPFRRMRNWRVGSRPGSAISSAASGCAAPG